MRRKRWVDKGDMRWVDRGDLRRVDRGDVRRGWVVKGVVEGK